MPDLGLLNERVVQIPRTGCILGFDYGTRRIGLAMAELSVGMSFPLKTIDARLPESFASALQEWAPVLLVVGYPASSIVGSGSQIKEMCVEYAKVLEEQSAVPVILFDESHTSCEAERRVFAQQGGFRMSKKEKIDAAAAQILLEDFLTEVSRRRHILA